jgi:hypothetical protein
MDDDLRTKASECISDNFTALLETREFHSLPTIKLELIGKTNKISFVDYLVYDNRFENA